MARCAKLRSTRSSKAALVIEAKVAPQAIDGVRPGQTAFVLFPAINQRTTPEFVGEVSLVAADLTREPQTGQAYFLASRHLSGRRLHSQNFAALGSGGRLATIAATVTGSGQG